jgi:SPP1 gp7 family putative phage head morphogenesis protein
VQDLLRRVLKAWEKRLPLTPAQLEALGQEAYAKAWGLAGVWDQRFLEEIQDSLGRAMSKGTTYAEWTQNEAQKILDAFGAGVSTYRGGERWDPWYSELVMRNATQASFAGGRYSAEWSQEWQQITPYWRYYATLDARTRPEHAALHGRVFRKDDAAARVYLPPLGHACRCQAIFLTMAEVEEAGYPVFDGARVPYLPTEDGGTVGRPPGGWDVDRVAANGSRVLLNSAPPAAQTI